MLFSSPRIALLSIDSFKTRQDSRNITWRILSEILDSVIGCGVQYIHLILKIITYTTSDTIDGNKMRKRGEGWFTSHIIISILDTFHNPVVRLSKRIFSYIFLLYEQMMISILDLNVGLVFTS